jgi:hypothetical protein
MFDKLSILLALCFLIIGISETGMILFFRHLAEKATDEKQKSGLQLVSTVLTFSAAVFLALSVLLWSESLPASWLEALNGSAGEER